MNDENNSRKNINSTIGDIPSISGDVQTSRVVVPAGNNYYTPAIQPETGLTGEREETDNPDPERHNYDTNYNAVISYRLYILPEEISGQEDQGSDSLL